MGTIGLGGENPRRVSGILGDPIRYEHVLVVSTFSKGQVSEIRLYPTDLGYGAQFVEYGLPRMADSDLAQKTLRRLQELSSPLGTTISIEGDVGVIRL
jgi:poly-gamma-glutamate synthesis protein (capsule biosynthesis protein)